MNATPVSKGITRQPTRYGCEGSKIEELGWKEHANKACVRITQTRTRADPREDSHANTQTDLLPGMNKAQTERLEFTVVLLLQPERGACFQGIGGWSRVLCSLLRWWVWLSFWLLDDHI